MVACRECGLKTFGGSDGRKASGLCRQCWHLTPEGAIERSFKRANLDRKPGKLWQIRPGVRVEKVTVDFGFKRPFWDCGTIVEEPYRDSSRAWKVAVQWDRQSSPTTVDTRRIKVISDACTEASSVR